MRPGLSVEECVRRLKRYHYAFVRLHQIFTARIPAEPLYELNAAFSLHAYTCAEHVAALRTLVGEMRKPPLGLDEVPDPNLELFFDEILGAPTAAGLVPGRMAKRSQPWTRRCGATSPTPPPLPTTRRCASAAWPCWNSSVPAGERHPTPTCWPSRSTTPRPAPTSRRSRSTGGYPGGGPARARARPAVDAAEGIAPPLRQRALATGPPSHRADRRGRWRP